MPVSENKILPFVLVDTRPARDRKPDPLTFEALGAIAVENIAEFWLGGPENRKQAEQAADAFRAAKGWK